MTTTNTYFMMPRAMKDKLSQIDFISDIAENKAKRFIYKLLKDARENNKDLAQFVPVPAEYFRKVYNGRYRQDFLNPLIENGIVQANNSYSNSEDNPFCKSYRLDQELVYSNDTYVGDSFFKETLGETNETISVSPDTYITKEYDSYINSTISIPYMLHHLDRAALKADFLSLRYDIDKLNKVSEDEIEKISFKVDEEISISVGYLKAYDRIKKSDLEGSLPTILDQVKKRGLSLIQDGDKFYLDDYDRYIEHKKRSIRFYNSLDISKLEKGIFNFKRNIGNNRLDSNFTTISKKLLAVIKEDNALVEIDLCNSQFAILAHWLKEEGLHKYPDVALFCAEAANGTLYDSLATFLPYYLHRTPETRNTTKNKLIQLAFSKCGRGWPEFKASFYRRSPNVFDFMNDYKKKHGYQALSVELQKREARIFIDNLLYNIKANGSFCITRHDSILVRKDEQVEVLKIMKAYFHFIKFGCSVKVEKEIIELHSTN